MEQNVILYAIPIFLLTIGIELWHGLRNGKKWYNFEDTITNLNLGIGSQATGTITKILVLGVYVYVYDNWRVISLPENAWWMFILGFVIFDYIYYWAHRLGHEWNYMWGAHIVHHQSEEFNLSVALRQSWFHSAISFFLFLPMAIFGISPTIIFAATAIDTVYQYWIHTKAIHRMPRWFEFIFNTPSHHRVHHATNPQYLDKNYAATFILWDRLHKTFAEEVEAPVYGITKPLESLNPVWANVHFYKEMWKGMKLEKGIFSKLALIVKGPEYLGHLLNEPIQPRKEFKPAKLSVKIYVLIQFVILLAGLVKYLMHYSELSTFYKFTTFALIIATVHVCSSLLESKKSAMYFEAIRLAGVMAVLNTLYYFQYNDWFTVMLTGSIILTVISASWLILNPVLDKLLDGKKASA